MAIRLAFQIGLATLLLTGCSNIETKTTISYKKLDYAYRFLNQKQPAKAEGLIQEALKEFQETKNLRGLSETYRMYGVFFISKSVEDSAQVFQRDGFLEKTATFDTRRQVAVYYFEKSRDLLVQNGDPRLLLPNVYHMLGDTNMKLGKRTEACEAFRAAQTADRKISQQELRVLPAGTSSMDEFYSRLLKAEC